MIVHSFSEVGSLSMTKADWMRGSDVKGVVLDSKQVVMISSQQPNVRFHQQERALSYYRMSVFHRKDCSLTMLSSTSTWCDSAPVEPMVCHPCRNPVPRQVWMRLKMDNGDDTLRSISMKPTFPKFIGCSNLPTTCLDSRSLESCSAASHS